MARVTGLEPATSGVTGRHSNQLSYTRRSEARGLVAMGAGCQERRRVTATSAVNTASAASRTASVRAIPLD